MLRPRSGRLPHRTDRARLGDTLAERIVEANGVRICTEPFGDPADPPILLIMGMGESMLGWDEAFCRALAERRRFVIRYDHRDTGRSATYEPGHPGYTGDDLTRDAVGVLDAYDLSRAHLVGVSAGGGIAQEIALDHPVRVLSLVLISTSPVVPVEPTLPDPTERFTTFVREIEVNWTDSASVIEYLTEYARVLAGDARPFDEAEARALARREVSRATDFSAMQNHDVLGHGDETPRPPLGSITARTLVAHGTADPMFPVEHGRALADEIPGATFLALEHAGHGVGRAEWGTLVPAILEHTEAPGGP